MGQRRIPAKPLLQFRPHGTKYIRVNESHRKASPFLTSSVDRSPGSLQAAKFGHLGGILDVLDEAAELRDLGL